MVVIPTSKNVSMNYGSTPMLTLAISSRLTSLAGVAVLFIYVRRRIAGASPAKLDDLAI